MTAQFDAALMEQLARGQDLDRDTMYSVMRSLMTGEMTPAQIGGFLVALRMKGETVAEITAAAEVMRELASPVPVNPAYADTLVDTCGTGGDASGLFNVSTACAFVVAAAGGRVAKHGNRSVSSKSGSADLLEAAGVRLDTPPEQVARCIEQMGVGFMFAPGYHGAMKHAIGPRKELGIRTLFNIIGPLTNPAGARNQVLGVFNGHLTTPLAETLQRLGSRHVMVVHGEDGLDELSINAPTRVAELRDGAVHNYSITPESLGLERASLDTLRVSDAQSSLALIRRAFGGEKGPAYDMISLNAGAAIYVSGVADTLQAGIAAARTALDSGEAANRLAALAELTQTMNS